MDPSHSPGLSGLAHSAASLLDHTDERGGVRGGRGGSEEGGVRGGGVRGERREGRRSEEGEE